MKRIDSFKIPSLDIPSVGLLLEARPFTYIPNLDSGTVSVIDTATDTTVATVPVGAGPTSVAAHPDGTRGYVTHDQNWGSVISIRDTFTNAVVGPIYLEKYIWQHNFYRN